MMYNLTKLNELASGDKDFIDSIISVFVEETPVDLTNLEASIESNDFEQIYQHAHKIKPNVDLLGMDAVTESILRIEKEARGDKNLDVIKALYPKANAEIIQTIELLKKDFGL